MTELIGGSPFARALGQALVQFLWQGAAIGAAVAVLLIVLRRSSPQARYLVAVAGLAAMAAAPLLTIAGSWREASAVVINLRLEPIDGAVAAALPAIPAAGTTMSAWLDARLPLIVLSWCAGVVLLTLHLAGGWWRLTRIARRATPIVAGRVTVALPALAGRLGITREVRLVESALVRVPSVIGWLRPVVVFPVSALAGLPPSHLEAILAHELAHIRRGDFVVNLVQCVVETLLFYHPAVWWVSRRIRVEREQCCDDLAAALSPTRVAYARALTSLEELQDRGRPVAVAANGGELLQRIRRILDPPAVRSRWSGGIAMIVVLTVLLMSAGGQTLPARDVPLPAPADGALVAQTPPQTQPQTPPPAGRGTIAGVVRDRHGVIPGAMVTVRSADQKPPAGPAFERSTVTNARGEYSIGSLPPGLYDLRVTLSGFKTALNRFTIAGDQTVTTAITLEVGALSESITVVSPLPASEAARARTGAWPSTPAEHFDAAKMYYEQGRLAEAEAMTKRALELLRQSAPQAPVLPAPPAPAGVVTVGGSIQEPRVLTRVPPIYPAEAASAGVAGVVIIEAIIATDGTVKNTKVLRSVPGLDQAALVAVQQWRFTPTLLNKEPVELVMTVSVNFTAK
jgi:TonB family protein